MKFFHVLLFEYDKEIDIIETGEKYLRVERFLLGIYSSMKSTEAAISRYHSLEGFNDHQKSCFISEEYELDKTYWEDGFLSK